MPALAKAFNIIKLGSGAFPAFSGVNRLISHVDGRPTKSSQAVDEAGSLRVAAIWIANTVLADEISSLTMKIVLRDDQTRRPQEPPALRAFWGDPNPDQTRMGIEATETLSMTLWGAAYTMLGWTRGGDLDVGRS